MGVTSPTPFQDISLYGVDANVALPPVGRVDPRSTQQFVADQAERQASFQQARERARQWMLNYEARLREANRALAKRRLHPIAQSVKRPRR